MKVIGTKECEKVHNSLSLHKPNNCTKSSYCIEYRCNNSFDCKQSNFLTKHSRFTIYNLNFSSGFSFR